MKKHSLYLRQDQTNFLKSLSNASSFMREILDVAIASQRGSTEKTITIFQGAEELEGKITSQTLIIEGAQKQAQEIEEQVKETEELVKVAEDVASGKFQVEEDSEGFKVVIQIGNKFSTVTKENDSEEEAREKAIERGKVGVKNTTSHLKEVKQKKARHTLYLKAQQDKLRHMQENLKTLYASMKR
jgi:hypothetical protein